MFNGKKEPKDLITEVSENLYRMRAEAQNMLYHITKYEQRRLLEKLIDSITRSRDDIRRNVK